MAMLENKTKENPKLEQNKLSDGRISLYLEYYFLLKLLKVILSKEIPFILTLFASTYILQSTEKSLVRFGYIDKKQTKLQTWKFRYFLYISLIYNDSRIQFIYE